MAEAKETIRKVTEAVLQWEPGPGWMVPRQLVAEVVNMRWSGIDTTNTNQDLGWPELYHMPMGSNKLTGWGFMEEITALHEDGDNAILSSC